mmetsp:Transcript_9429/g.11743  ORF Transcript_9429/g.11743 Transcript_9429/m.11743 type:complete len:80 (+) Transcript_9429:1851-2090(+)
MHFPCPSFVGGFFRSMKDDVKVGAIVFDHVYLVVSHHQFHDVHAAPSCWGTPLAAASTGKARHSFFKKCFVSFLNLCTG